jgi:hypothetical protein
VGRYGGAEQQGARDKRQLGLHAFLPWAGKRIASAALLNEAILDPRRVGA